MNVKSAKSVLEFVHIRSYDQLGRPCLFLIPGHEGRRYEVSIVRNNGAIHTYCRRDSDRASDCPGSLYNTCYHSIAAVMKAARVVGLKTAVCRDEASAYRAAKLHPGANITKVITHPSGKEWWVVTWEGGTK